mgnify:CR=1 FL=1
MLPLAVNAASAAFVAEPITARIASGLTASAATVKEGVLGFDSVTGNGYYSLHSRPDQTVATFNQTITGDESQDALYVANGVRYRSAVYNFRKDSAVDLTGGKSAVKLTQDFTLQNPQQYVTFRSTGDTANAVVAVDGGTHQITATAKGVTAEAQNTSGKAAPSPETPRRRTGGG